MRLDEIGYITEPVPAYAKGLDACGTHELMVAFLDQWRSLATDAAEAVRQIPSKEEWARFVKGLRAERRGQFAGKVWAQRYGCVTMPEVLFQVSIVAERFKVPWGLAYVRCKEFKFLIERDGIAVWKGRPA